MAAFIDDHVDQIIVEDFHIDNMDHHPHEDTDVPLLSDEDTTSCQFKNISSMDRQSHMQSSKEKRQLIMATSLCFVFMIAELIGGYLAGSLAIMTDAAHLFSDCISFIVALIAMCLSRKKPDSRMTFGYKRAEVLGAIVSIFGIWILTTFLLFFASNRLFNQDFNIDADTMMYVSAIGVFINIIMAIILHGDGVCGGRHNHSHSHGHQHKHKHSDETFHNNNKAQATFDLKYKLLNNDAVDDGLSIPPTILIGGRTSMDRNNSICSYRSPSHSRTNSFSRMLPINDVARRASYSNHNSKIRSFNGSIHRDSLESDITRSLIETKASSKKFVDTTQTTLTVEGSICPSHNYVHRDSSDYTYVSSEDDGHPQDHSHNFSSKNINIQAAVIHVIGDFIQSIGVFTSAVVIKFYPEAKIADPLCTFVFSIIVMFTTIRIMKESIMIILEAVPGSISHSTLLEELSCIDGVRSVHHLNVWSLTVGWNVMSAHITIDPFTSPEETLLAASTVAKKGFGIKHCTIQIERINLQSDNNREDFKVFEPANALESTINSFS